MTHPRVCLEAAGAAPYDGDRTWGRRSAVVPHRPAGRVSTAEPLPAWRSGRAAFDPTT